jgi:hypothetical protein
MSQSKTKSKTKSKSTKTPGPLKISIHGDDLDIEASFSNDRLSPLLADTLRHYRAGFADAMKPVDERPADPPGATSTESTGEAPKSEHDFDVVRRVIGHADAAVLQAILDLAKSELDQRQTAS